MKKFLQLATALIISHSAGIIGSMFNILSLSTWYENLAKPVFNPPNWIFAPVWLLLYTLMGVALYFVWQKGLDKRNIRFAFMFFITHLFLNVFWSVAFFGLQNPFLALCVIAILWFMILALILMFFKIDKRASYLLIPYLLWVSFAAVLNYSIWQLNI